MTTELSADQKAAHQLLSELRTRVAVQPLPYQYGVEARALESLWELFGLSRTAMKDHPGCGQFAHITTKMLNVDVRPVTAKWHRAHQAGVLDSRDGANEFRADLSQLQKKLVKFAGDLQLMAYGSHQPDDEAAPVMSTCEIEECFRPVRYGLISTDELRVENASDINAAERQEIVARRQHYGIQVDGQDNAVGLALSGGGIRSATFCLGVVQVLAERDLLKDIDYLSTVSGGGYTGSFITSQVGGGVAMRSMGQPYGPDTDPIRHLRQNAKYMSAKNFWGQWEIIAQTIAGLLLNLTGPFATLCAIALLILQLPGDNWLLLVTKLFGIAAGCGLLVYAITLRSESAAYRAKTCFSWALAISMLGLVIYVLSLAVRGVNNIAWSSNLVAGITMAMVVVPGVVVTLMRLPSVSTARKVTSKVLLLSAGCLAPLVALMLLQVLLHLATYPMNVQESWINPLRYLDGHSLLVGVCVLLALIAFFFVDVNLTGIHRLYRDQLAKTFVNSVEGCSSLALNEVNATNYAPYHLLNATVNFSSREIKSLKDRGGDFFLMSKHWMGSPATGYFTTSQWKAGNNSVDLATAMAVSGAAASPQMGLLSKRSLAPLLSLMNVRLNYWIKSPSQKGASKPGFLCLLREILGVGMLQKSKWFNLSDGGHIENMGVYELLRRRCKFIICVDGEADPKFMFAGQMTLVRHAQVDFGIRLEPRLDEIRFNPDSGVSRSHIHLLRVHYPVGADGRTETGLMLYLKLSVTGDETELLKRYRMLYPEFPHQSTVNQFYGEEQFEAYRQLGVHVAEGAFSPALLSSGRTPTSVCDWFRDLAQNMLEPSRPRV
ncbi:MAG: hypothetical protein RSE32_07775 [Comamonas sp.]|uniref:hypothetical protein n=1 Tax=Comamonas sp. TaxID=34028 RepID=UPI002FCCA5BA